VPDQARPDAAPMPPLAAGLGLLAFAVGAIQRGGYNPTSRTVVLLLAGAALLVGLLGPHRPAARVVRALVLGWLLIVGSAALSAGVAGDVLGVREVAGLATLFAAGVVAGACTPPAARPAMADGLLLVGVVVAVSAWVGIVWRILPYGYHVEGVWRGGSTLTYANAAAALLAAVFVLSVVRLAADPRVGRLTAAATFLTGVGLATTLNRGGYLAVAAGLLVVLVAARRLRVWPVVLRQVVAVGIAAAGVVPSLDNDQAARPAIAVATLLLGGLVAVGVDEVLPARLRRGVLVAGAVLVVVAVALAAPALRDRADQVADARLALGSDDRVDAWGAAVDEVQDSPVVGNGPSTTRFEWTDGSSAWTIRYVHNEYLELLATQGLVGGLAALAAVALLVLAARGVDLEDVGWLRVAVLAALVAFAVHCAFDFTMHVPVLAVGAGLIGGLALPDVTTVSDGTGGGDPSVSAATDPGTVEPGATR
jgi:O-antigen ligase